MTVSFFAMKGDDIVPRNVAEDFNCSNANAERFLRFLGVDASYLAGNFTIEEARALADKGEENISKAYYLRLADYVDWLAELVEQAELAGATTINYG